MRRLRRQVIDYKKLELVTVATPESAIQAVEDLMVFDARVLRKHRCQRAEILCTVPSSKSSPERQSLPLAIRSVGSCGSFSLYLVDGVLI
jgi:hypothetical protein